MAVGAIISEIPCIDQIDIDQLNNGDLVEVDAENGLVTKKWLIWIWLSLKRVAV